MKIKIINGPNMNMLGIREPEIYGRDTYDDLVNLLKYKKGTTHELIFFQSNHEGDIVDEIQQAFATGTDGIIINPAAFAHTSIAIRDALAAVGIPAVEVHVSDISSRESFRKNSYLSDIVIATVAGIGIEGYLEAVNILEHTVR